ncbi:MAG TPA: M28 family metallopeptidase [Terriglobales bacterium]|jgi:N-acetylated-alpha-linked acidic dipeptidase|nr:M28 family metallopeptidase [Terriglobales bacterium]
MKLLSGAVLFLVLIGSSLQAFDHADKDKDKNKDQPESWAISGFRDVAAEREVENKFLAVPDPKLAEEHLRILTQAPHIAGSPEDKATAGYVANKFREAGLDTEIVEYKVWFNYPAEIRVEMTEPPGVEMHGPHREHVDGDPYQDDPRVVTPYNGMSPSGDAEAEVVYANYGSLADFDKLKQMNVDVRGKIVIVRYGENFRGVKEFVAQECGAVGVIVYSDPKDDGYYRGDAYPKGPWRPASGVQRGSVGFMFQFPGDPTTPGVASTPALPDSKRVSPAESEQLPKIPVTPLSYADASPILEHLGGPASPREWQGALPFTYHVGPGPAKVKMHLKQDYQFRTIWDVIGKFRGASSPDEWVVAGNHRDAWVYGAVDPNSGTAAMLEAVHGLGELLKSGWKPKRTIVFGSWDAEEEGLIGSTEWGEDHAQELGNADAYFNMDVAVSGKKFGASGVPSLKEFIREIAKSVPSPQGGTVYDRWKKTSQPNNNEENSRPQETSTYRPLPAAMQGDVPVGDLGSGSDYTVFLQHLGVPSTDISSSGDYGVYHSVFDNFAWFKKFGDPDFRYEQQMARIYGLEVLRMSSADVLPYDYENYGKEILVYLDAARTKSKERFGDKVPDFSAALESARQLREVGAKMLQKQRKMPGTPDRINAKLRDAERALLIPAGLPNRPWFHHAIYAPGQYTGYAAVVIPGVNEAIDRGDLRRTEQQIAALAAALNRTVLVLE